MRVGGFAAIPEPMSRFVVQGAPSSYVAIDAPSPRAAAMQVCQTTKNVIVWYRTRTGWASWTEGIGRRTRYMGKVDEHVAALLPEPRVR